MDKAEKIRLIQERIKAEHKKHPHLNWELIAAAKIYSSLIKEPLITEESIIQKFIKRIKDGNKKNS